MYSWPLGIRFANQECVGSGPKFDAHLGLAVGFRYARPHSVVYDNTTTNPCSDNESDMQVMFGVSHDVECDATGRNNGIININLYRRVLDCHGMD